MTVSIHTRAYRALQIAPPTSPTPTDKRLKRSHGKGLQQSDDRTRTKDSLYTQRSTSPLSVVDINEELNLSSGSCSSFVDKLECPASPSVCIKSRTKKPARRVHWNRCLITEVATRPRTLPEDVPRLFYSSAEMSMFRRNYYAYMNSQSRAREECVQEEEISVNSVECKPNASCNKPDASYVDSTPQEGFRKRQLVVKAVVCHQGEIREYYHQDSHSSQSHNQGPSDSCNFDNPDFWNGTITWF